MKQDYLYASWYFVGMVICVIAFVWYLCSTDPRKNDSIY